MSIMPKTAYQQGFEKHWLKNDPFAFYTPQFAHIGEQAIVNSEVMAYKSAGQTTTWGYTPSYSEYKYINNRVAGAFRDTLDFWHMGRIFDPVNPTPLLNSSFIECVPEYRPFAVTDPTEDHMLVHVLNKIEARRLMPKYGTPHM